MRRKTEALDKTPYLPPEIEEEREHILDRLNIRLYVHKLQFGVFYRKPEDSMQASRRFSNEYELSYRNSSAGVLHIEYERKLIRIRVSISSNLLREILN